MYERLKDLREDRELSQKTIAAKLNIAQTTYSDYELGKINIPLKILREIALLHQTSTDYLLDLTDEQKPYPAKK